MYDHQVHMVRQHVTGLDFSIDRIQIVFNAANNEADRSSAILIFALIEDIILNEILRYTRTSRKKLINEISTGSGLLSTANDRIQFVYLLSWIQENTFNDMKILKSIRNNFAHNADITNFDDEKIKLLISSLSHAEKALLEVYPERVPRPIILNNRQLLLVRSLLLIVKLIGELAVAPEARASRVAPGDVTGTDWDLLPSNMKELNRIAARTVSNIIFGPGLAR